jgi:hypothetical protein
MFEVFPTQEQTRNMKLWTVSVKSSDRLLSGNDKPMKKEEEKDLSSPISLS